MTATAMTAVSGAAILSAPTIANAATKSEYENFTP
jgi:hypothetical protein